MAPVENVGPLNDLWQQNIEFMDMLWSVLPCVWLGR